MVWTMPLLKPWGLNFFFYLSKTSFNNDSLLNVLGWISFCSFLGGLKSVINQDETLYPESSNAIELWNYSYHCISSPHPFVLNFWATPAQILVNVSPTLHINAGIIFLVDIFIIKLPWLLNFDLCTVLCANHW